MSNTARKLEFQDEMEQMTKLNHQAFANIIWNDPAKAIALHTFWKEQAHDASPEFKRVCAIEIRKIEAILQKMTALNAGFHNVQASAYVDSLNPEDIAEMQEVMDEVTEPATEENTDEKAKVPVKSLFNGKDMGDKPHQAELAKSVRELLEEGNAEYAKALATQYLGSGNYTPKKSGAKPVVWKEEAIESWIRSLRPKAKKDTDKADDTFGKTQGTLAEETAALRDIAQRYVKLALAGSEDTKVAENLAGLFFKDRLYKEDQITAWKQAITTPDVDVSSIDHFQALGCPTTEDFKLIGIETTYEEFVAEVYDMMQEIQVTKPQMEGKDILLGYMKEEVGRKMYNKLIGKTFLSENAVVYEMWTRLHVLDFIDRVVTANFTQLGSPATETEEAGQEQTGEDSASEEQTIEASSFETADDVQQRISIGNTVKSVTVAIIRNGGVVEDTVDNPRYTHLYGKEHKFQTQQALEKYVAEHFEEWEKEYKNALTAYPMKEFLIAVDRAYYSEIPVEETIEASKEYMVKPDGTILSLLDRKKDDKGNVTENITKFPDLKTFEDYIKRIYQNNKNAESIKESQQSTPETKTDTPKEEKKVETKVEGKSTKEETKSEGVNVKMAHIQNVCNKLAKKNLSFDKLLKDQKISALIEKGGTISGIGENSDQTVEYDLTAESLDQLRKDLEEVYNATLKEKKPGKSVAQMIKDVKEKKTTETPKEETKEAEASEESTEDNSLITDMNAIQPEGLKLIKEGYTQDQMLEWGEKVLLNRKMDQHQNGPAFTSKEAVETFMKSMFKEFFEFDGGEVENTEEESSQEEETSEPETESKVFVPEKISVTDPTLWKQVSGITSLEEIYNVALELCEAGDWQTALNMSIELITTGGIKDAEGWNDDQITSWFNTNVLKKAPEQETEETVQEPTPAESTDTPELNNQLESIGNSRSANDFRKVLLSILTANDDNPDLRKNIIGAIRGGKGKFAKKMAKAKDEVLQYQINTAKKQIK